MEAEREKRAEITLATAEKERLINISEGERQLAINISEGEKQKRINEAEGKSKSIELIADATAKSMEMVGKAISDPCGDQSIRVKLVGQYIEEFQHIIENGNVSVFPAELATLKGIVEELKGKRG